MYAMYKDDLKLNPRCDRMMKKVDAHIWQVLEDTAREMGTVAQVQVATP